MDYRAIYPMLIEAARSDAVVSDILLGLNWSMASLRVPDSDEDGHALCFSPQALTRTIPWAGTLQGKTVHELAPWVEQWDACSAVVGALVINAVINSDSELLANAIQPQVEGPKHLAVFNYFRPQLNAKKVAVIGHYPGLEGFAECAQWHCIERNPKPRDLPDPAARFILPDMDWVFITASSLANKSLPGLLEMAAQAQVVLMGPSLPWLAGWADFGVNYLAGVAIQSPSALRQVVAQAGGTRIFDEACHYRIAELGVSPH